MNFSKIYEINPSDLTTWDNKIFLTIDVDWAHDQIILDTIELLNSSSAKSTWFITHKSELIEELKKSANCEIGIHPNFNKILFENTSETYKTILDDILNIVPNAKSVRSHSMTQNSRILDTFFDYGLTHDVNHFVPYFSNNFLNPWIHWNGLIKVPYIWEDDIAILYKSCQIKESSPSEILRKNKSGIKVFDFHPIHIFLNTENMQRYEETRHVHQNPKELINYRFDGYGTRNMFIELITKGLNLCE